LKYLISFFFSLILFSQEEINYKYYGPPYYPEVKLEKKDSLKWPLKIELSVDIKDIKYIDINSNEFISNFLVSSYSSYDDQYITKNNDTISLRHSDWFSIYLKDIERSYLGEKKTFKKESYPYLFKSENNYKEVYLVEAPFDINWNFRDFPFDDQQLKLKFTTLADTSIVKLTPSINQPNKINNKLEGMKDGYFIESIENNYSYNTDATDLIEVSPNIIRPIVTETLNVTINLNREGSWLFLKLFSGGFLAFIISCLVFLIPPEKTDARATLNTGAIFGAIGNRYFVDTTLPQIQVFTKADAVNNLILFFIVINIILMVYQTFLKDIRILNSPFKIICYSSYALLIFLVTIILW